MLKCYVCSYCDEVMGYVRARLMFAILRATNLCIRGSQVKWRRRMEIEDGAGLPLHAGVTLICLFIFFVLFLLI